MKAKAGQARQPVCRLPDYNDGPTAALSPKRSPIKGETG